MAKKFGTENPIHIGPAGLTRQVWMFMSPVSIPEVQQLVGLLYWRKPKSIN